MGFLLLSRYLFDVGVDEAGEYVFRVLALRLDGAMQVGQAAGYQISQVTVAGFAEVRLLDEFTEGSGVHGVSHTTGMVKKRRNIAGGARRLRRDCHNRFVVMRG